MSPVKRGTPAAHAEGRRLSSALRAALGQDEHTHQVRLLAWLELQQARWPWVPWVYAVPNFSGRLGRTPPKAAIRQAVRLNQEGRKEDVPDLVFPVALGGWCGLYLEMKAPDGHLRPGQRRFLYDLHRESYLAVCCWGFDPAQELVEWYAGQSRTFGGLVTAAPPSTPKRRWIAWAGDHPEWATAGQK